jgi:CheY-like chemotaxis protein
VDHGVHRFLVPETSSGDEVHPASGNPTTSKVMTMNQLIETRQPLSTDEQRVRQSLPTHELRVLHLEDNPADALLTQEYVRGSVPDVSFDSVARLGDVTSEMATTASCAIVDLSLPDASGLEALYALRAMSESLPIIVLTGLDDLDVGLAAIRGGAEDYLVKNFVDGDSMGRAIRYAMERRHLSLELSRTAAAALGPGHVASPPRTAQGTHQVAVAIDVDSSEWALRCETCTWEAAENDPEQTWAERHLEGALLKHVAFGNRARSVAEPSLPARDASEPVAKPIPIPRRGVMSRRGLFRD